MKNYVHKDALIIFTMTMFASTHGTEHGQPFQDLKSQLSKPPIRTIKGKERGKRKDASLKQIPQKSTTSKPSSAFTLNENSSDEDIIKYLEQNIKKTDELITALQNEREPDVSRINHLLVMRSLRKSIKSALQTMNALHDEKDFMIISRVFINNIIDIAQSLQSIMHTQSTLENNDQYAIAKLKDHPLLQQQDTLSRTALQLQNWNALQQACEVIHAVVPEFPLLHSLQPQKPVIREEEPQEKKPPVHEKQVIKQQEKIIPESPVTKPTHFPTQEEQKETWRKHKEALKKHDEDLQRAREERRAALERMQEQKKKYEAEQRSRTTWLTTNLNPFTWINRLLFDVVPFFVSSIKDIYAWITSGWR